MAHASKSKRSAPPSKKRPAPHPKAPAKAPSKSSSSKASAPKSSGTKPSAKPPVRPGEKGGSSAPAGPAAPLPPANPNARRHILSLSFLRDGDEFMARLETDGGQITEMKNRSLDQLLTLVAGELEDLLE
jgi:hypothetical protein